jgi:MFS family permease
LTHSGTALGVVTALQYLPILFLGPWGGVVADRFPKRQVLAFTQAAFGVLALVLGGLVLTGWVRIWMVDVLAFCYGLVTTLDNPTRQSFVVEMVGEEQLRNAVTLYSSLVNLARIIGPALAGFLIATVSLAPCFLINGLSYGAVVIMLWLMRPSELLTPPPLPRARGQVAEGFRYVLSTPVLRSILVMMAIIGTLTFEFQVSLPLLAQFTFHGDAQSYAALTAAMGIGAVFGGLLTAGQKNISPANLVLAASLFGGTTLLVAIMPDLRLAVAGMVLVGISSILFTSLANSILQLTSVPQMRGRVMALWSIAFLGSTTFGGPIVGWIGENIGPRWGLGVGGIAGIVAAALGWVTVHNLQAQAPRKVPLRENQPGGRRDR